MRHISDTYVKDSLPKITEMIELMGQKSESVKALREDVFANLTRLKEQIAIAREAANRVRF